MTYLAHIVRHGESEWNRERRIQGQALAAGSLTDDGRLDARRSADEIARRVSGSGLVVVSSDLPRAVETAAVIAARISAPVETNPAWRENDLGELEGLIADDPWEGGTVTDMLRALRTRPTEHAPGGESHAEVCARVLRALGSLAGRFDGGEVVVVSHGGVMRTLIGYAEEGRVTAGLPRDVANGAVATFSVAPAPDGTIALGLREF